MRDRETRLTTDLFCGSGSQKNGEEVVITALLSPQETGGSGSKAYGDGYTVW